MLVYKLFCPLATYVAVIPKRETVILIKQKK